MPNADNAGRRYTISDANRSSSVIRTLIVEDEAASRMRLREILDGVEHVQVVGECADGPSAVQAIARLRPDLVLLDIQLPGLDGFGVMDAIPTNNRPAVLFITAYDEYAIRAFDANAVDYVLKPFSTARFTRALNRALERLRLERGMPAVPTANPALAANTRTWLTRFVVRSVNRTYFVAAADVDWIDVADNYVRLHTAGRTHLVRGTISAVMQRLDPVHFVRVNRGLIARIDAIRTIESTAPATYRLTMRDGARLTSSRTYAADIRRLKLN